MLWGGQDNPMNTMVTQPQSPQGHHWGPSCRRLGSAGSQPQQTTGRGQGPPHKPTHPSLGYRVPSPGPFPPSPRWHLGAPAAPLPPAHFKRPHLSPSAAFERSGEFPAGAGSSPRPP